MTILLHNAESHIMLVWQNKLTCSHGPERIPVITKILYKYCIGPLKHGCRVLTSTKGYLGVNSSWWGALKSARWKTPRISKYSKTHHDSLRIWTETPVKGKAPLIVTFVLVFQVPFDRLNNCDKWSLLLTTLVLQCYLQSSLRHSFVMHPAVFLFQ